MTVGTCHFVTSQKVTNEPGPIDTSMHKGDKRTRSDWHTAQAVSYMVEGISHVCRNFGPRAPGSEGERKAAEYFAGVLERECGCKSVRTETFKEHPAAFYGYFWFSMTFDCLCAALFFVQPHLSILSGAIAFLLFFVQFVLYKQLIDPLFPEKESVNVTAVRPCAGEVRQRIFLNGHIDAAWEFPLNYYFGGVIFEVPGVAAIVGVLFYMTLSVCTLCGAGPWTRTAGLWGLLFVPFFILVGCTYNPARVVDGANDNLTGCFLSIAVLREMERLGITPEHTEVGVILTGSEEAGLRGAKAWCEAHKGEYLGARTCGSGEGARSGGRGAGESADVPTYIICFDTIHDPRELMVNMKDLNSTVRSDEELGKWFLAAAKEAGIPCKCGRVPLLGGSTDSAAFTQAGFRSIAITGLSHKLEDYYHTRKDSCDNLNKVGLENCYEAAVRFIENVTMGTCQNVTCDSGDVTD